MCTPGGKATLKYRLALLCLLGMSERAFAKTTTFLFASCKIWPNGDLAEGFGREFQVVSRLNIPWSFTLTFYLELQINVVFFVRNSKRKYFVPYGGCAVNEESQQLS